jgi:hypothetical protein
MVHCRRCQFSTVRTYPNSVYYFILLSGIGSAVAIGVLNTRNPELILLIMVMHLLAPPLLIGATSMVHQRLAPLPLEKCPKCGASLTLRRGFYDFAWKPTLDEGIGTVLVAGFTVLLILWFKQ